MWIRVTHQKQAVAVAAAFFFFFFCGCSLWSEFGLFIAVTSSGFTWPLEDACRPETHECYSLTDVWRDDRQEAALKQTVTSVFLLVDELICWHVLQQVTVTHLWWQSPRVSLTDRDTAAGTPDQWTGVWVHSVSSAVSPDDAAPSPPRALPASSATLPSYTHHRRRILTWTWPDTTQKEHLQCVFTEDGGREVPVRNPDSYSFSWLTSRSRRPLRSLQASRFVVFSIWAPRARSMEPNPDTHSKEEDTHTVHHVKSQVIWDFTVFVFCLSSQLKFFVYFLRHTSFSSTEAGLQVIDSSRLQSILQICQSTIGDDV